MLLVLDVLADSDSFTHGFWLPANLPCSVGHLIFSI